MDFPIDYKTIERAYQQIQPYVNRTPFIRFDSLSRALGREIYLKCENFQKMGSFKVRGATNFLLNHLAEAKKSGVITASAGNHAQGVAYICQKLGVSATIVMPTVTPPIKVHNTELLGAKTVLSGSILDESFQTAEAISKDEGRLFVHPFKDPWIIAGQASVGIELAEDPAFKDMQAIAIPIGGGGLICGVATVLKKKFPKLKIYGVVAKNAPSQLLSFQSKQAQHVSAELTLADGVATKRSHPEMLSYMLNVVDDVVAVSEESISHAISMLGEDAKMISEGAAALPVAAIIEDLLPKVNTALLISGGNVDIPTLSKVLYRGLVAQGRLVRLVVTISDRPGGLNKLTSELSRLEANILQVYHNRSTLRVGVGQTQLDVEIETRDSSHSGQIVKELKANHWIVERVY